MKSILQSCRNNRLNNIIVFVSLLFFFAPSKAQYLYPEHYLEKVSAFCLDCGEPQAMPPSDYPQRFMMLLNEKALKKIEGDIYVQILVDSTGKAQLLSADNQSNVSSKKLNLQHAINNIHWTPAGGENTMGYQSVQLLIRFKDDMLYMQRLNMSFGDKQPVDKKDQKDKSHTHTFKVYNTANSSLPWNMSRAVAIDASGVVWMGTDQGLVRMQNGGMYVFNQENSPLTSYPRNKKDLHAIMALDFDSKGRLWISQGYDLFLLDNEKWWKYFNKSNSPVNWCTGFNYDKQGNLWVPTFHGAHRYDNGSWTTVDSTTHPLPSNNIMAIYADSRNRLWIGSSKGSLMAEGDKLETFEDTPYSIKEKTLSNILEDGKGNIWLAIYGANDEPNTALMLYDNEGRWHEYMCPLIRKWRTETISDIALNEKNNELWISVYHIGLLLFHTDTEEWELYTPDNSNLPDAYIEDIELDNNGKLWGATFGGIVTEE
ncbi:MAG: hypothetical protein J6Y98_08670 [Bacteroidales bacterium]|nr:hypothetical protein [Bacteroidales bacterium]